MIYLLNHQLCINPKESDCIICLDLLVTWF